MPDDLPGSGTSSSASARSAPDTDTSTMESPCPSSAPAAPSADQARRRRVNWSRAFYDAAFGLTETVIRHTDENDFTGYEFGDYGQPGCFLLMPCGPESFE
jgi:hypothetical protein